MSRGSCREFAQWYTDAEHGWMAHIAESAAIKMQLRLMFLAVGALFSVNVSIFAVLVVR